jgi:hypothetical protein
MRAVNEKRWNCSETAFLSPAEAAVKMTDLHSRELRC